jgi:CheY-like chemotaxis protein
LRGIHVLVVDDQADTRELTASVLKASGAKVVAEPSARHALERLAVETPQVMLVDISMPEMDGYAFIRRVRESRNGAPQIPAIAFTAYAREEDKRLALTNGFQMHLSKPVEPGALVRAVASVLAG